MMKKSTFSPRLKREECYRTKHDCAFSNWEILIGPSDWENHSSGKNGTGRYRLHNLPISSMCPGIYELGIAVVHSDNGRDIRKLGRHEIVVVYLGHADNVRTRLQQYGRGGSHLDHGNQVAFSEISDSICLQKGPGLFKEIFGKGFSIVFRWARMENKKQAAKIEALLLGIFDYAWNRAANGCWRRNDILVKLDKISPASSPISSAIRNFQRFKVQVFDRKQMGTRIDARKPLEDEGSAESSHSRQSTGGVFKFSKSRPRLVLGSNNSGDSGSICGVIEADGSVCQNRPVVGRKRCSEHKGKRIDSSRLATSGESSGLKETGGRGAELEGRSVVCGVSLEDGSVCMGLPPKGRKRCELHKGRRITNPKQHTLSS